MKVNQQDYKMFFEMLERLEKIDLKSAKYLKHVVKNMKLRREISFVFSGSLIHCFDWARTYQGHLYWSKLSVIRSFQPKY